MCDGERLWATVDVPLPRGWRVRFEPSRRGYLGMADGATRRITIWMRTGASDGLMRNVMYHEVAHAYDFSRFTQTERQRWKRARGLEGRWFGCDRCSDFATPAGDFAESFAVCHTGDDRHFASKLGGPPDPKECHLLRTLTGT